MKVAIPKPKYYIMGMSRIKKIAHILNLVLIGARLARAILQAYELPTGKRPEGFVNRRLQLRFLLQMATAF